jgi:hypothetical protein
MIEHPKSRTGSEAFLCRTSIVAPSAPQWDLETALGSAATSALQPRLAGAPRLANPAG